MWPHVRGPQYGWAPKCNKKCESRTSKYLSETSGASSGGGERRILKGVFRRIGFRGDVDTRLVIVFGKIGLEEARNRAD